MSLQLQEVTLGLDDSESMLVDKIASRLGLPATEISNVKIIRKGIDARKKPLVKRVYTVVFDVDDEDSLLSPESADRRLTRYRPAELPVFEQIEKKLKVLVVGMGPAGLFAALSLVKRGAEVILIERGDQVETRVKKVQDFWSRGEFDPASNVQFGEGGAGTFSDGKLTTRVNSPWNRLVLQTFVDCGAPVDTLIAAKPHLGTDLLRRVLIEFRKKLQVAGVQIKFRSCLTGIEKKDGRICAGIVNDSERISADALVLAPGHSARDTYAMLSESGVRLEQKPFAVGFRVEHPAELINEIQYGMSHHPNLSAADYALSYNDAESGRSVYSFCMCPGGEVIAACSEADGMVVNGMSSQLRDKAWSNSALVVSVGTADFDGDDVLAGIRFQQQWERLAFQAGGGNFKAPAQNLLDFLGAGSGPVRSTCRPGVSEADLSGLLPPEVIAALIRSLPQFNRRMKGFVTGEAVLVGIESRTSAPLRVLRNEQGESVSHQGLFPCGEGAGYAGGIMSAAFDGLRTAERIINHF